MQSWIPWWTQTACKRATCFAGLVNALPGGFNDRCNFRKGNASVVSERQINANLRLFYGFWIGNVGVTAEVLRSVKHDDWTILLALPDLALIVDCGGIL